MKHFLKYLLIPVLLLAAPVFSFGQYFSHLYDHDSAYNWGWNLHLRNDGNFFATGWTIDAVGKGSVSTYIFNADGSLNTSNPTIQVGFQTAGEGDGGQQVACNDNYYAPFTITTLGFNPARRSGIIKYNNVGDTVFVKTFTDSSSYYDVFIGVSQAANSNILLGGQHYLRGATTLGASYGQIARVDTMGDTLWTKVYTNYGGQDVVIKNVFEIDRGRIVAGGYSMYYHWIGSTAFYHFTPWFLLLDSAGTIIRDTLYGARYRGGGAILKDIYGGYMHYGQIDSIPIPDAPGDPHNVPFYITHLDTNFRMDWVTDLPYYNDIGSRQVSGMKQLHDSSFIAFGDSYHDGWPFIDGWACKIDRRGHIIWDRYYHNDTVSESYIRDMIEKPDGSLVFIGASFNDTLPAWHQRRDLWIFGTDANGCEVAGCSNEVSGIAQLGKGGDGKFSIYPNPGSWQTTVDVGASGQVVFYGADGRQYLVCNVLQGKNDLQVASLPPGVYNVVYLPVNGGEHKTLRFVCY